MYISLKDSCANCFRKWADAHQPVDEEWSSRERKPVGLRKSWSRQPGVDITRAAASSMARAGRGDDIKQIPPIPLDHLALHSPERWRQRKSSFRSGTPVSPSRKAIHDTQEKDLTTILLDRLNKTEGQKDPEAEALIRQATAERHGAPYCKPCWSRIWACTVRRVRSLI